eukprot:scaffold21193_cov31-Tisochrysis_lutea.AAC.4
MAALPVIAPNLSHTPSGCGKGAGIVEEDLGEFLNHASQLLRLPCRWQQPPSICSHYFPFVALPPPGTQSLPRIRRWRHLPKTAQLSLLPSTLFIFELLPKAVQAYVPDSTRPLPIPSPRLTPITEPLGVDKLSRAMRARHQR